MLDKPAIVTTAMQRSPDFGLQVPIDLIDIPGGIDPNKAELSLHFIKLSYQACFIFHKAFIKGFVRSRGPSQRSNNSISF